MAGYARSACPGGPPSSMLSPGSRICVLLALDAKSRHDGVTGDDVGGGGEPSMVAIRIPGLVRE